MRQLKFYFKSKEFIICSLVIIILISLGVYDYFQYASGTIDASFPEWINRFSFWRRVMFYGSGTIIMFLSPFIIGILSLNAFYYKIKGSYLKNSLLRQDYNKMITKEIILSYIKAYLPFFILSLFVLILGSILYTTKISNYQYADSYTEFSYVGNFGPYAYIMLCQVALFLYVIMIVNIGFIVLRYTKKIMVTLILSFAIVNALNFLIGNFGMLLEQIIGNNFFVNHLLSFNIYEGYMVQSTVINAIINMGILALLSGIVLYFSYRNKERVVRDFE